MLFSRLDGDVGMNDECRGNYDGGTGWESNVDAKLPEDHVSPLIRIEIAKGSDCTPAKCEIGTVDVGFGDDIVTNVEHGGGP